ncbi:MAG: hypothetical protein ACKOGH_13870 [Alphaproteobacteria bacterium]
MTAEGGRARPFGVMVEGARLRTQGALRDLLQKWAEAGEAWDDATAGAFGTRYVEQLDEAVRAALPAMEKMAELLHRVQRDCEDPR